MVQICSDMGATNPLSGNNEAFLLIVISLLEESLHVLSIVFLVLAMYILEFLTYSHVKCGGVN